MIFVIFCSGNKVAVSQTPESLETKITSVVNEDELVHFGDQLDVDVLGSFEYDWRGGITPEGFLDKSEFSGEPIPALCRNVDEIAQSYADSLSKFLRDPQVSVKIIDRSNRPLVELLGSIKNPQRFRLKRPVYLNELLVLGGGLTESASGEIQIFRPAKIGCLERKSEIGEASELTDPNETKIIKLLVSELLSGKKQANPRIYYGDLITVLSAEPVYVIGGVRNPKQIAVRSQISLSRAIDSAGGTSRDADINKVIIYRRQENKTNIIEADLNKIKNKEADDLILKAYDIVEVAQKGSKRSKYPPVIRRLETENQNISSLPLRIIE